MAVSKIVQSSSQNVGKLFFDTTTAYKEYIVNKSFIAGTYTISCLSNQVVYIEFWGNNQLISSGSTTSGTVTISIATPASSIVYYSQSDNVRFSIELTGVLFPVSGTVEVFTSTTTYPSNGYGYVAIIGGGGGGSAASGSGGGGGGSGGIQLLGPIILQQGTNIVVGSAGTGGIGTVGNSGGNSQWSSSQSNGGSGGIVGTGGSGGTPGGTSGGPGGVGTASGTPGNSTSTLNRIIVGGAIGSGGGGGSHNGPSNTFSPSPGGSASGVARLGVSGGGAVGGYNPQPGGGNANGYGSGGGGGGKNYTPGVNTSGGNGSPGVVMVLKISV